jgi:tRNA nucleotidyltransferase/poly(A) polymerase
MSPTRVTSLKKKMSRTASVPDIFILPQTAQKKLPYFAICVYNILAKQFPKTYFVGGVVRNILLNKKVGDLDLVTSALPTQVEKLLKANGIAFNSEHKKFGIIVGKSKLKQTIEIATFRGETYGKSRFPKVVFIANAKQDSKRRDFTVNALYYSLDANAVLDYHDGLTDILERELHFIGNAQKRIIEDPLRIIRAYRFASQYNLSIDKKLEKILQSNLHLLNTISASRIQREINLVSSQKMKTKLEKVIHSNT